ncbi:uncharacterized protein LOC107002811 isoform X2 [Solanum pennellii]|uniref:Uncharacterized protein LOC107002811 isoform X2 n=1 Tax=Solanum pennellii TaxID=28526 RepID=A0ABM1FGB8_SOLPN|nr:uncharacterized protein LOC107002811 isoform X2 [Solanum pennellii]
MDLEEWEILPDDGFLQIHDDDGKMIFSRKYSSDNSKNEFNMNYFICPSPKSSQFVDTTHQLVPLDPNSQETSDDQEKVVIPIEAMITKVPLELKVPNFGEHHDQFSQVFFKKMKENEFDNMKIDSPKSINKSLLSQFEEKTEDFEVEKDEIIEENGNSGLNLLNKSLNGIGAICSFGVAAAATICIIFIGNHQKHKQNQKIRFQIFTDEKRIKRVVQHATRLNEAISAVRGVPVTRAQITVGGYYDAL